MGFGRILGKIVNVMIWDEKNKSYKDYVSCV